MFTIPPNPQFLKLILNGRKPHPRSKFTRAEDDKLRSIVQEVGENSWDVVSKRMGNRNQRQCKERWLNYLSPNVNFSPWTLEEDQKLENLHAEFGAKWVKIAQYFPSRTDTNIKNRWMVLQRQKKRLERKSQTSESLTILNKENEVMEESSVSSPEIIQNDQTNVSTIPQLVSKPISDDIKEEDLLDFKLFDDQLDLTPIDIMTDQCFDYFF